MASDVEQQQPILHAMFGIVIVIVVFSLLMLKVDQLVNLEDVLATYHANELRSEIEALDVSSGYARIGHSLGNIESFSIGFSQVEDGTRELTFKMLPSGLNASRILLLANDAQLPTPIPRADNVPIITLSRDSGEPVRLDPDSLCLGASAPRTLEDFGSNGTEIVLAPGARIDEPGTIAIITVDKPASCAIYRSLVAEYGAIVQLIELPGDVHADVTGSSEVVVRVH